MNRIMIFLASALVLSSCGGGKEKKSDVDMNKTDHKEVVNYVDTVILTKRVFHKQIVCNGKLRAISKIDLPFASSGTINDIKAYNGSVVKQGELLASLDTKEVAIEMEKAQRQMEKAHIDLIDKLIGQGYDADTVGVPEAIMKSVKISSGYDAAAEGVDAAQRKMESCYLYAPFGGRVANMDSKVHQRSADKFCILIDDSYFDVEFNILEAEISEVAVGQEVAVSPFVDESKEFRGEITQINPIIDDKGQIKVRAKVKNTGGYLIEGMNVRILIENAMADRYVVPKDAVVIRDGYFVLFRYVDGLAVWTYVDVVMSNIDSHVITGNAKKQTTISENDVIIISGNLSLADGTAVTPKSK